MEDYELQCNHCGWIGYALDLLSKTEDLDDNDFIYCPDCEESDGIEDIEEDGR